MKPTQPPGYPVTEVMDALEFDFSTPAYSDFAQHLDVQLTQLVALWQHLAAPAALRVGRTSQLCGRAKT